MRDGMSLTENMRLIVCGGRNYGDRSTINRHLDILSPNLVITGAARGADQLAEEWARLRGVPLVSVPALWGAEGRSAGVRRNQRMLDLGIADGVLAFPGGRGTSDMVRRARKAGLIVADLGALWEDETP